jgi:hypothetical protein
MQCSLVAMCSPWNHSNQHAQSPYHLVRTLLVPQVLDLRHNRFAVWPLPPACVLPALEQLSLAHNPLRVLPADALCGVGATLRSLDLSGIAVSALSSLAPAVGRCGRWQTSHRRVNWVWVWKAASSKAEPRQKQDWFLKCL